jgi:hypothetical protein
MSVPKIRDSAGEWRVPAEKGKEALQAGRHKEERVLAFWNT